MTMPPANTVPACLTVAHLSVARRHPPTVPILHDISLQLYPGEIYALVGESGSGKSMTALAIMRLLPDVMHITHGDITLGKQNLFQLTEQAMTAIRGKQIAMIFQEVFTALNPVQRIGAQLAETLKRHTALTGAARQQRVLDLLTEVGLPAPKQRCHWYPHQLSGGQQQRVMIAMALACEPAVLLADEPSTALDVTIQQQILGLLQQLTKNRRLAVLLITHDMGVVRQTADRVGVMHCGHLIEQAACSTLFAHPQQPYTRQLINSLPCQDQYRHNHATPALLRVDNLTVHFPIRKGILQRVCGYTQAVNGIHFTLNQGETLALVGESGCGKTTTGRAILNLERITAGTVWFRQQRISGLSRQALLPFRKSLQVIFQSPYASMNPRMTVGDIIEEGMVSLGLALSPAQRRARVIALLKQVRLEPQHRHRYPHAFSGGQRQRIAIARALAVEPELIICDEPTSALDVSIRADILTLLLTLQKDLGVSYLFITHDLSIIPSLAHRVAVMQAGKIIEQGPTEQVLRQPQQAYTQQLLQAVPTVH